MDFRPLGRTGVQVSPLCLLAAGEDLVQSHQHVVDQSPPVGPGSTIPTWSRGARRVCRLGRQPVTQQRQEVVGRSIEGRCPAKSRTTGERHDKDRPVGATSGSHHRW